MPPLIANDSGFRGRLVRDEVETGIETGIETDIGQLRRRPSPPWRTRWRPFFIHTWLSREDDACVQAKRDDKVPLKSRRGKNEMASHCVVSQKLDTLDELINNLTSFVPYYYYYLLLIIYERRYYIN